METKAKITPIRKVGRGRTATLHMSYEEIVAIIGEPNTTDIDDSCKVSASWGMKDQTGREVFVWAYKTHHMECKEFSFDGDKKLGRELFGERLK